MTFIIRILKIFQVPRLLQRHSEEVRALKEQLRRQKEKNQKADKSLRSTQDELSRQRSQVKKLQQIVEKKNLGEREKLASKLTSTEAALDDSNRRVQVRFIVQF